MRNLKKFLALVLAMMMTLSLMVTVNAKNVEFDDGESVNEAFIEDLTVLAGMGVIQGMDDGKFAPQSTVTRAQMAAIVYRLRTGDASADPEYKDKSNMYAGYGDFKDVKDTSWYAGYVGYCANAGIIIGDGDGNFRPNSPVTGYEALVMLLRAMGYDQPNEFTGGDWRQHAASIATQRGMLAKVNTTSYRGTLMNGAAREVVAEITFQAAINAQVVYTAAFGYQTTGMFGGVTSDVTNPSLGYQWYGLSSVTRVILGNQATGEGGTLLGNSVVEYEDANGQTQSLDVSYVYPGSVIDKADVGAVAAKANITVGDGIGVDAKTGLDMFGHKVTVWFANTNADWKPTYAMFDRSTLTATVQSMNGDKDDADNTLSDGTPADAKLGMAAQKAGFTVDLKNSKAWVSDRYSRIVGGDVTTAGYAYDATKAKAAAGDTKSAVAPAFAASKGNGIYALISNNSGKTVDVIISLAGEVGIIAQKDTTATVKTLTVGSTDKTITNKSSFIGVDATAGKTGIFAINSLTEGSTQTLGDKVTAWQIVGTNNAETYDTYGALGNVGTHTNGNVGTGGENFRYDLEKLETTVSGTVRTYGTNHEITMTDGTTYQQSWFRWLPTGGRAADAVIGTNDTTEPYIVPVPFQAGVTYTIALDKFGNWLGAVPARDQFIYGTFGDYSFGNLGTGTIGYTLTGVNWNGEKVVNHKIVSMNLNSADYFDGHPTANQQLADGYSNALFSVTKKMLDNSTGNRIQSGKDTGFVVSEDGALTDVLTGYGNLANATGAAWTIGKNDVANGFADLSGNGTVLATSKTQFIVVTGTGTDTLDVKIYDGMAEFLGSSDWVSINLDDTNNESFTYYLTEADLYNRYNTEDNKQVAKVIVDARDVTWTGSSNVYYSAPGAKKITNLNLAGNPDAANIEPFELWNNGVKGVYWIDKSAARTAAGIGSPSAGVAITDPGTANTGDFYNLVQINTVHGTPIYKAVKAAASPTKSDQPKMNTLANGGVCNGDLSYTYTSASELMTGRIGGETFKVGDAVVADIEWSSDLTRSEIKSVADINAAISGGYTVKVAIVNDGVNVKTIYVISVT